MDFKNITNEFCIPLNQEVVYLSFLSLPFKQNIERVHQTIFKFRVFFSLINMEKKKFEDMRKAVEDSGYEVVRSIGKGAFGQVLLVKKKVGDQFYAVKVIGKAQVKKKPFLQKYIEQEIDIMKKLNHKNIVRQEASIDTQDFILLVLDYCDQGNLLTYQARLPGKTFPLEQALRVLVEVLKGLKCIHEKNFIHRDIKSQNILLKKGEGGEVIYKIADFGFARSIGGVGAKTHCGTQKYMAPEILSNSYYGISVDIWALGVLFYFMLFAQYPFKGHDMKAEINRRCTPVFSLANTVSKKEKLKDMPPEIDDFFKKIFVVDSKKRMTFSSILKHPILKNYEHEFSDNAQFYNQLQKKEQMQKDDIDNDDYDIYGEPEDQSRAKILKKKVVSASSKHLERELEEINFEIQKLLYLRECANELYDNYSSYLTYAERLAAKYYLLKVEIFYSDPLLRSLASEHLPEALSDADIDKNNWKKCTKTPEYKQYLTLLEEENMKAHLMFEDVFSEVGHVLGEMPIKNFEKGYRPEVIETSFQELKFAYRSTTSHIFKSIHENKKIHPHTRNKIKLRLFCCHMINRIFNRKEVGDNFPFFVKWLQIKHITYPNVFDFHYFKQWIHDETQDNLEKNIGQLHKTFF